MENTENKFTESENTEPKFSRRSRSADNRDSESRAGNERPPIVFGNVSRFNFDPSILADKRYEFGFTPYIVNNDQVMQNFDNAMYRGWECMEASEYPQAKRVYKHDPFRRRESEDDFIRVGGQIAMRRPIELKEAEDRYFDEENFHKEKLVEIHKGDSPGGTRVFSHSRTKGIQGLRSSYNS